jgi:uncharacterized membrane protein
MAKSAGMTAAIWVLLTVMGLVVLIGVILVMMWFGGGIQHSPTRRSEVRNHSAIEAVVLTRFFQSRVKGAA